MVLRPKGDQHLETLIDKAQSHGYVTDLQEVTLVIQMLSVVALYIDWLHL